MKKTISILAAFAAFAVFGVTPNTEFQDVPGTDKLGEVLSAGGAVMTEQDPVWNAQKGGYQPKLVSGTNIKTVNGNSLLGNGNVEVKSGDGLTTNAVIDIIHKTVDGSARPLPKYLHALDFDDSYPDAAAEYYRMREVEDEGEVEQRNLANSTVGLRASTSTKSFACSSVRDGGFLYRNFDYPFDDRAEFIVRVSSRGGDIPVADRRFASVGVSQVGTNLTEEIVTSGKPSRCYKWLPGATVDGINENGVACNINVVDGDPQTSGWHTTGDLHPLGAIRWILDHATNAQHGAEYIAANIRFPQGWEQNFHYMIADATSTYIVENGESHLVGGDVPGAPPAVLTNFRLYPSRDTTGEGQERYDALVSGANITSQWWTLTYAPGGYRASDLPGITGESLTQLFNYWASMPREQHRGETFHSSTSTSDFDSIHWWQTVHTSVYDLTNLVLRVAVQEHDDWYVFAIDQANVDLAPIEAQIAALQDGKRGLTDLDVYEKVANDDWTWTCENKTLENLLNENHVKLVYSPPLVWEPSVSEIGDYRLISNQGREDALDVEIMATRKEAFDPFPVFAHRPRPWDISDPTGDKLATRAPSAASAIAKFDANGKLVAATADDIPHDDSKRDLDDNTCHKTGFTEWTFDGDVPSGRIEMRYGMIPFFEPEDVTWLMYLDGSFYACGLSDSGSYLGENATSIESFRNSNWERILVGTTATRSAVCTDGKKFVTSDVVDGKVSAAVSTNNPAFVSAVRNTPAPEPGQGEDPPWGTWGTVGAAIAGLVSGLAWVKNKIGVIFDNEGEIQNDFATGLLGKQVAIQKVQDIVNDMFDNGDTTSYPRTTGEG